MKNSNRILVGTGLLFVMIIFILIVVVRLMFDNSIRQDSAYDDIENLISENYDLKNFDKVEIDNSWKVTIRQKEHYKVDVTAPKEVLERTRVVVLGDRLVLDTQNYLRWKDKPEANVTMPNIVAIAVEGAATIDLEGFSCNELRMQVAGACKVSGRDNKIENLYLRSDGASSVDLTDSRVRNADLDINGAGSVELKMDGGELTGMASGAAKIVYYGTVSKEKIMTNGMVSVRHRD